MDTETQPEATRGGSVVICPVCEGYGQTEHEETGWLKCVACKGGGKMDPETAQRLRSEYEICSAHSQQFCEMCRHSASLENGPEEHAE